MAKSAKAQAFIAKIKNGANNIIHNPSFTLKEQAGFAAGTFGNTMAQDMCGTFLMIFLTDYMGIAAAYLTILMVIAKIVNIVADPVAGIMLDRTHTRFGQARPYLLITPLPLAITSILLFVVPNISMLGRIIWVFAFYLIYCLADTFYDMSLLTVSARMTTNPHDRKNFYTVAQFAGSLGSMLPGGVIPVFISLWVAYEQQIYLIGAIVFGVVGLAVMMCPFFTLREKTLEFTKPVPVKINAKAILMNRPLLLSMVSRFLEGIRQVCFAALPYFYKQTLGAYWLSTVVGTFSATFSYIGIALVPIIGRKCSSRTMMMLGFFYTGIWYVILQIVGFSNVWVVGAIIAISGASSGLIQTSRKVLVADSTDYMEWKTWKKLGKPVRSDGMVFAMNSLANKFTGFFTDLWLPLGLTAIGYVSARTIGSYTLNVVQEDETLKNIFLLLTIPGIAGNFLAGGVLLFDTYTGKRKEKILAELAELHASEKPANQTASDCSGEPCNTEATFVAGGVASATAGIGAYNVQVDAARLRLTEKKPFVPSENE